MFVFQYRQKKSPRLGQDGRIENDSATKQPTLSWSSRSVSDPKHILSDDEDTTTKNVPSSMTACNGCALQQHNVGSWGNIVENMMLRQADPISKEITPKLFEVLKHNKRRRSCVNQLIEGSEISLVGLPCSNSAEFTSTRAVEEPYEDLQFQTTCFVNRSHTAATVAKRRSEFVGEVFDKSFQIRDPSSINTFHKLAQVQQGEQGIDGGRPYPSCSTSKIPDAEATHKDTVNEDSTRAQIAQEKIKSVTDDLDADVDVIFAGKKLDSKISMSDHFDGTRSSPNFSRIKEDQTASLLTSSAKIVHTSCQAKSLSNYSLTGVTAEYIKSSANASNREEYVDPTNRSSDCRSTLRQNVIKAGQDRKFLIGDKKRTSNSQNKEAAIRNYEHDTMSPTKEYPSQVMDLRCKLSAFSAVDRGTIENVNVFTDRKDLKYLTKANPIKCTYETRSRNPNKDAKVSSATQKESQQTKRARRTHLPFSHPDIELLVEGVERLGTGRWRDIKRMYFAKVKHRTSADLKDKWRSLVHSAMLPSWQRRGPRLPTSLTGRIVAIHKEENNGRP